MFFDALTKFFYVTYFIKFYVWDEGISLLWCKREVYSIKELRNKPDAETPPITNTTYKEVK